MERVAIVGLGLIGGSIALKLQAEGLQVCGFDTTAEQPDINNSIDIATNFDECVRDADLVVVATPVQSIASAVVDALDKSEAVVTDVGSVKSAIVQEVQSQRPEQAKRYVPGHPMAGSEQSGFENANAELFVGAPWVLTPVHDTDQRAFALVRQFVATLGAEPLAVDPREHDALVALVSHVPQLASTTLMDLASERSGERALLLRLAAGGFRDMTRIAASNPSVWADVCMVNDEQITKALDGYIAALTAVRENVARHDRDALVELLERSQHARRSLPTSAQATGELIEVRVLVPDQPGVLAEVTTLASDSGVNIADVEVAHSPEGSSGGVLVLLVPESGHQAFVEALRDRDYQVTASELE